MPHLLASRDTNDDDGLGDSYLDFLTCKSHIASLSRWTTSWHQIYHTCSHFGTQTVEVKRQNGVLATYSLAQLATNAGQATESSLAKCDEPYK